MQFFLVKRKLFMTDVTCKVVEAVKSNKFEEAIKNYYSAYISMLQVWKKLKTIALHCKFYCEKIAQFHLIP